MALARAGQRLALELFEHLYLRVVDGVRIVIAIHPPHVCFALLVVEALHVILAGFV